MWFRAPVEWEAPDEHSESLWLELREVVSHLTWMLETRLKFSKRTKNVLNHLFQSLHLNLGKGPHNKTRFAYSAILPGQPPQVFSWICLFNEVIIGMDHCARLFIWCWEYELGSLFLCNKQFTNEAITLVCDNSFYVSIWLGHWIQRRLVKHYSGCSHEGLFGD